MSDYRFYNRNPLGKREEDCVCRAISTALDLPYDVTSRLLLMSAEVNGCDSLCVCCYHHLLEDVFGLVPHKCRHGESVGDISFQYPRNIILIRIAGHLTVSVYGCVLDIWDCTSESADIYWLVK